VPEENNGNKFVYRRESDEAIKRIDERLGEQQTRIHELASKMDSHSDQLSNINQSMASISVNLQHLSSRQRPCPELIALQTDHDRHLADHQRSMQWIMRIFGAVITAAILGVGGYLVAAM